MAWVPEQKSLQARSRKRHSIILMRGRDPLAEERIPFRRRPVQIHKPDLLQTSGWIYISGESDGTLRLLLTLRAMADQKDISLEYHKLQGFVYGLLGACGYTGIHDKKGYKYFCFSNLFPYGDMKEGDTRRFIISSPSPDLIDAIAGYIAECSGSPVHIGDGSFTIEKWRRLKISLPRSPVTIATATPIIIRIPERNYDIYGVPEDERRPRYVYWRPAISFDAFVKQLTVNLLKKYNGFYGTQVAVENLFEQFFFRKEVHTRIIIEGKSYGVAASLWRFSWSYMNPVQKMVIEFGLDAGFGERNSFGFGFVNPVTPQVTAGKATR